MKPTTNVAGRARFALVAALYKQQLGEVIRDRREELGLTQKELAVRANVEEPQTVSRWERGLNAPTDLEAVARALETTADQLLKQLRPLNQKERRPLDPTAPNQLDRIERKLDEVLEILAALELPAGFEQAVAQASAQRASSAATPGRTAARRKAS